MRRLMFIFLAFLLFSLSSLALLAPIAVEREITGTVLPGGTTEVSLNLKFTGEPPSGIIVSEYLPEGWTVASSLPLASKFDDRISWVIYGDNVKNSTIVYELKAPDGFSDFAVIDGSWTVLGGGGLTEGDSVINLTPADVEIDDVLPPPVTEPPAEDNTLLYAGLVIIILLLAVIAFTVLRKKGFGKKKK